MQDALFVAVSSRLFAVDLQDRSLTTLEVRG